ncbi:MAG: hypothetical protein WCW65_00945 [Candidatus Paceibacterota bacterium]
MEEINNEKINIGIKEIKEIKMTPNEKGSIFRNILNSTIPASKRVHNPWSIFSSQFSYSPYLRLAVYLIVIFGAGGILITSQGDKKKVQYSPEINTYKPAVASPSFLSNNIPKGNNIESTNNNPIETGTSKSIVVPPSMAISPDSTQNVATSMSPTSGISANSQNYTNIASIAFSRWFTEFAKEHGGVLDYKINKITFITTKNTATESELNWFINSASNEAFIVSIDYSVRATEENINDFWIAGNGERGANEWVLNKFFDVTIDKINDTYSVINAVTGF